MKDVIEQAIDSILESNVTPVDDAIAALEKQFPGIKGIQRGEEWGAAAGSIHLGDAAEGGTIDEFPAADMYFEDPEEEIFQMGVNKKLEVALADMGYSPEFYDGGTLIAYPM